MLTDAKKRIELEQKLLMWQERILGEPSYDECDRLTDYLSDICREGEPLPVWAIAIRKLVGRIRREGKTT